MYSYFYGTVILINKKFTKFNLNELLSGEFYLWRI